MSDSDVPIVGVEELDEPEGQYLVTINGDAISGTVRCTRSELSELGYRIDELLHNDEPIYRK